LKVLPFASVLDERQVKRFRNEARAAAQLKHPNIVQVFGVGFERSVHFYAPYFQQNGIRCQYQASREWAVASCAFQLSFPLEVAGLALVLFS
jgi:serine/threonine protein kinase